MAIEVPVFGFLPRRALRCLTEKAPKPRSSTLFPWANVLEIFSSDEKGNVEKVTKNITESLSILINKDLDLFSSKINQQQ